MNAIAYETLQRPLPAWHPKAWYFALVRASLGTIGRLSHGVRIGQRFGFDSGVMLDHIYCDKARGSGPLGRFVDRIYLSAPGWAGIRNRGRLMQNALAAAIREKARGESTPVRLADLACGGGQYVLDALAETADVPVRAVLRDYRDENVARAAANAQARGVSATVERGDAFSDIHLAQLGALDLAVVSGLHEIITDDRLVRRHFRQLAERLVPGGILVVTVQPDHPQLEFIARTLKTHTGRPWTMRLRSVDLIRSWASEAGFEFLDCEMETSGIFGVARFRRR